MSRRWAWFPLAALAVVLAGCGGSGSSSSNSGSGGPPPTATVADLAVSITVDNATPAVGGPIHYTITAAAQGTGASTGVVVDSLLPSSLTFVSATASMGSYVASSGVWTVGDMPANTNQTLVLTATVNNNNTVSATITNSATAVESSVDVDPNQTNNSAQVKVVVAATVADLAVGMTVDNATPAVGDTIHYTITADARGTGASTGVVVNSLLPPSLTYVSATASMGSYAASSGVWTVGDMPAHTSQTLVLAATVNNNAGAATIPNTATAGESPVDVDPDQTNNITQADVNVAPGGSGIDNVQPIFVNAGITGNYANGVFTSVELCVPGTTNCQTIDNVLVDTGSYGLRLLSTRTSGDGLVSLPLPQSTDGSGHAIGECTQFQDAYTWGPVATADIQIAGEKAASVPIQILGQAGFAPAPSACTGSGLAENDSQSTLGANGVLGIGVFRHDCGANCTAAGNAGSIPPVYFSCPASGCVATDVELTQEVQNPVWLFPQDNDGVIVRLPAIPNAGAVSATGTLTFGIGTQSNNALSGTASVLAADGSTGGIKTVYQGVTYPASTGGSTVLDTGSNGIFFLDQATLNYPACPSGNTSFYCPAAMASFSVTNQSAGTGTITTAPAAFSITSADTLFANSSSFNAFSQLGGPDPNTFDFGLPFFFGRTIYFGINLTTRAGLSGVTTGPFFAY
jgi:uncharacterized repeat protein (TIGR01451 family)